MMNYGTRPSMHLNPARGGIIFRMLFLIFFLALLGVVWLVREPILRLAGGFLIVDDAPRSSDVIVVLDDDYDADSAARAAELFKAGWAPRVVASGEYLRPYASEAELTQKDLIERGVPATSIIRLAYRMGETREEVEALGSFASSHGWKKILVVAANYRTRRMRYILERSLASGTELHVVAARDSNYDPNDWWKHRMSLKNFLRESAGFFVALWEMRHKDAQTS
jgi:uncharacterized SAM-binding protein YcdF (DUF218 family)